MGRERRFNEFIDNEKFQRNSSMTMSITKVYGVRKKPLPESEVDARAERLVR